MKCPACGQTGKQQPLGRDGDLFAYHCEGCGRLYTGPEPDMPFLICRVNELKARADAALEEHAKIVREIAAADEAIQAARAKGDK